MHPQPIGDPDHTDAVVLDLLLTEHPGIWTIDELKRHVGSSPDVEDALTRLRALRLLQPRAGTQAQRPRRNDPNTVANSPMPKDATTAVALAIDPPRGGDRLLLVLDDTSWTIPGATLNPGEPEAQAISRTGHERLGVVVDAHELIGEAERDASDSSHRVRVHRATIHQGVPAVPQPHPGPQYVDWRWADAADLKPAARAGSLAAQVLLRAREVPW
jgi:ADP-ribose pyrophosphatase YjhB (NUDIX family)